MSQVNYNHIYTYPKHEAATSCHAKTGLKIHGWLSAFGIHGSSTWSTVDVWENGHQIVPQSITKCLIQRKLFFNRVKSLGYKICKFQHCRRFANLAISLINWLTWTLLIHSVHTKNKETPHLPTCSGSLGSFFQWWSTNSEPPSSWLGQYLGFWHRGTSSATLGHVVYLQCGLS